MAMENCFQVVSSTARASVVHYSHSFSSPKQEKVKLPKSCKTSLVRPSAAAAAALSFSSSSARSINPRRSLSIVCKASVDQVQVVTDTTWQTLVVGSEIPVLVDFWAPWCGPCRMIAPIIDELAKEYAEKVVCYKLNTDDCPTIASHYGIRSIPTVLFFKDGEKKESVIGAVPKSTLFVGERYSSLQTIWRKDIEEVRISTIKSSLPASPIPTALAGIRGYMLYSSHRNHMKTKLGGKKSNSDY